MTEKYIHVRAKTKAKKEEVKIKNGKYFISVKEKAERGKANAKILQLLAKELQCTTKDLKMIKGGTHTSKTYLLVNK